MSPKVVIGVMGGAVASSEDRNRAYQLGALIARHGWVLLNGGRNAGIMAASAQGAKSHGGLTVGILPGEDGRNMSEHIDIPIFTGLGSARNAVNVLSSRVVVACPGGAGTLSEIALALKLGRPVIEMTYRTGADFRKFRQTGQLQEAATPEEVVGKIETWLTR